MDPVSYTARVSNTVDAMFTGPMSENLQDVLDWMVTLLPVDASIYPNGMGGAWVDNGGFGISISQNQYVYIDEDGFHCVEAGAFEMHYKKDE